ncbi:MAG: RNA-binding S4 domain-containing protein, partial [Candidatus Delongbacteria bacterium]|nr:RNA-binding S4 domain-containing protein [Candidatus Delongbacteria bacterium]
MIDQDTMRIDKWLKIARFYKQRVKASDAVENAKVKVNNNRVKPS